MGTIPAPKPLTRRQICWDLVLAVFCVTATVVVHMSGMDAIAANRRPDLLSVLLTIAAVAPVALRRRFPLAVLAACFPGFLALIAMKYPVGAAPIGVLISFYTVIAWDSHRRARHALVVLAIGYATVLLLHPVDLSVQGTVVQVVLLAVDWVIGTGVRERREYHASQMAFERERAAHAATDERLRITRELHDILGHAFSVMVVQAGVAEHLIDTSPADARRALAELSATGRTSLAEMRRLLRVLREGDDPTAPPRDPTPTLADVPGLIARVEAAGLPVDLRVDGTAVPLPPGMELAAYRVIQEALTNCVKHSGASAVRVHVTHKDGALDIEVRDNGTAVPRQDVPHDGQGLAGMRERVTMYGGQLSAGPNPDGYLVRAELPAQPVGAA